MAKKKTPVPPNAQLTTFYGGIEIDTKNKRYRYEGQGWKDIRDHQSLMTRMFTEGGEMPYHEGIKNINWVLVFACAAIVVFIVVALVHFNGAVIPS